MVVLAEKGLEASICREKRRITVAKVPFPDLLEMPGGNCFIGNNDNRLWF